MGPNFWPVLYVHINQTLSKLVIVPLQVLGDGGAQESEWLHCWAERWEFPLPAHVDVRSTAQSHSRPLRSPLTYNFIPLRWNRSALAHILNSSACLTPAVFNRSLGTHCLRGGRGAGLLRNCCGKIRFTSILSRGLRCGWTAHLIHTYSAGSVAALIC